MGSVQRFQQIMSNLGYELEEQEGTKLTYQKNAKYSVLVLVIDLGLKYVGPILVPKSVIILEKDLVTMQSEFYSLLSDANTISEMSNGVLKVLNQNDKPK